MLGYTERMGDSKTTETCRVLKRGVECGQPAVVRVTHKTYRAGQLTFTVCEGHKAAYAESIWSREVAS